ncbi:HNH endonuclease signature motif containing protein [Nocardioides limicola]|uniref:HNH endonuclease signature motif containing protein n=1 Tax=Nocardioides limicola TaxID=2803368 RepID=UPI00193B17FE|nr:HNH endonuclease signature motif containing protein [Nocardioides sp. DJM-14]
MEATDLTELTSGALLDFAGAQARSVRVAEVQLLRAGYQWAVLNNPDTLPATTAPGRERARRWGGQGTPEVAEFAAAEFGARLGVSPYAARALIADALDLEHRFPLLWARVQALEVKVSYARHVVARARDLTAAQAGYVDARVVESADGRVSWSRFETLVTAAVDAADLDAARERETKAAKATFARKLGTENAGMASFLIRADVATIDLIDAAVTTIASKLAATLPEASGPDDERPSPDELRVRAVAVLAGIDLADIDLAGIDLADLMPRVQLFVHLYGGVDGTGVARIEGHQPVTEEWVRHHLGRYARFTIRPVFHPHDQAPVDAWEIPDRHRQAVRLMTPADVFPYASSVSRGMQIDHTVPHAAGGVSGIGNYGPMTSHHHRIKTFTRWQVKQPFPGIYLWQDPHGHTYLVDHTGTRAIATDPRDQTAA